MRHISVMKMLLVFLSFTLLPLTVHAVDSPEDVITYRKRMMRGNLSHLGAIGDVLKGKVSFKGHIVDHARGLNGISKMILDTFPKGTGEGKTRAKPEIWEQWSKFEEAVMKFEKASADMVAAAETGDMAKIGGAMKALGGSCGGCHKAFRKKKK